ncbi:hypothetical protein CTAYLR_000482 [Chrysophaeum taylorii]|uniref:Uncharacterized protein n=1 Tax=Chrysophaeum taylorii TaxID=2483200 RepID=A0AAD7UGW5_9STRA|nr:hypothetical protein CTAYLR_000482 [Chrysophaeum taylorii]
MVVLVAQQSLALTMRATTVAPKRRYINLTGFPFPLGPFAVRRTTLETIVKDRVWGLEQEQTLFGIRANTRMVAVKLRSGDLWVYNPVAPTRELVDLVSSLPFSGRVAHVVLGTTQYEHKIFAGPFARKFPEAAVHCVPDQWSFPLDLPPRLVGIPTTRRASAGPGILDPDAEYAFSDEFDFRLLRPESRLAGNYAAVEAAFVHKDTKTLVLTDALVNVPRAPPRSLDPDALAYLGRSDSWVLQAAALLNWRGQADALRAAARERAKCGARRGWERNALLALTFGPSPESLIDPRPAFDKISDRWLVAPVCQNLVYASDLVRPAVRRWVEDVAKLDFVRLAPAHFAVARCSPAEFRRAFDPIFDEEDQRRPFWWQRQQPAFPQPDAQLITQLAAGLKRFNII